jgi:hypothetical protein
VFIEKDAKMNSKLFLVLISLCVVNGSMSAMLQDEDTLRFSKIVLMQMNNNNNNLDVDKFAKFSGKSQHIVDTCNDIIDLKKGLDNNQNDEDMKKTLVKSFFEVQLSEDHKPLCELMANEGINPELLKEYDKQHDGPCVNPNAPSAPTFCQSKKINFVNAPHFDGLSMPNREYKVEPIKDLPTVLKEDEGNNEQHKNLREFWETLPSVPNTKLDGQKKDNVEDKKDSFIMPDKQPQDKSNNNTSGIISSLWNNIKALR